MSARAIGCGSLAFGAVSIPVKLFTTAKRRRRRLLERRAVGARDGGVVTDEQRDEPSREAIDIVELVPVETVGPAIEEHAVYLGPDHGGAHAYVALARTLARSRRVAIAHHAAHGEAQVVVVRAEGGVLLLQPLEQGLPLRSPGERDEDAISLSPAVLALAA